jgi:hypothetical protein
MTTRAVAERVWPGPRESDDYQALQHHSFVWQSGFRRILVKASSIVSTQRIEQASQTGVRRAPSESECDRKSTPCSLSPLRRFR